MPSSFINIYNSRELNTPPPQSVPGAEAVSCHLVAVLHDPGDLRYVLDALHGSEELRTEAWLWTVQVTVQVTVLEPPEVPVEPTAGGVQVERRFPATVREIKPGPVGKFPTAEPHLLWFRR